MTFDVMIIGGTGIGDRLVDLGLRRVAIPTSAGWVRGYGGDREGVRLLCVQRHSAGHKTPPHMVNYRSMAVAAKVVGVRGVLATAAVGCLRPDWTPGTLVACTSFLDLTCRQETMFDRTVEHIDFTDPMPLHRVLIEAASLTGAAIEPSGVYAGLNGPRYETPSEIEMVRRLGGDLVGMTATSEATLFRELGIPYGCLGIVTNMAAGLHESELSHQEVVDVMVQRGPVVVNLLLAAARSVMR